MSEALDGARAVRQAAEALTIACMTVAPPAAVALQIAHVFGADRPVDALDQGVIETAATYARAAEAVQAEARP